MWSIYIFRSQASDFLNRRLGEESKQIRRRRYTVNIMVTFLSWALEFVSGMFVLLARVLKISNLIHWSYLIDVCLVFVVIPCTYLLNREITKQIIVFGNWYQGFRSIFCEKKLSIGNIHPLAKCSPSSQRSAPSHT